MQPFPYPFVTYNAEFQETSPVPCQIPSTLPCSKNKIVKLEYECETSAYVRYYMALVPEVVTEVISSIRLPLLTLMLCLSAHTLLT